MARFVQYDVLLEDENGREIMEMDEAQLVGIKHGAGLKHELQRLGTWIRTTR